MLADAAQKYVALALRSLEPHPRRVIAIGGLAGTGKSTLASLLAQKLQAVHIRSDAVRKHLCGIEPTTKAPRAAYSVEMNMRTYREILARASHVLESDRTAILDAVFHSPAFREQAENFANEMKVPFAGYWCDVSPQIAKERVRQRTGDISDADESVIALQQTYDLGNIAWQRIDTSMSETQVLSAVLSRL